MRGYGPIFYLLEAYRGLRSNSLVNALALGTICMAMLIVGFSLLVFLNLTTAVRAMGDRLEMSVFLKDGLSPSDRDLLLTRLKSESGVRKAALVTKDQALTQLIRDMKGQEKLFQSLGENPLPDSYELTIDPAYAGDGKMEGIAKRIAGFFGVEDVSYGKQGAEMLGKLLRLVTYGGMFLAVLLGVSVVFIISNSVRLALYSRGQEIELMQWIGATRWFVTAPFLVEGILITTLGASLAVGILAGLFHALPGDAMLFLSGPGGFQFLPTGVIVLMIGGCGLLGLAGGLVSVNKFLD
ncbi:MAG: ABC transporter permease [Nitrospirota bacterium]|nr:ABC transporter permease [Nitrospirota bacterium]